MINNALPEALDDRHHDLAWQGGAPVRQPIGWAARLRLLAAQVAGRVRGHALRRGVTQSPPAPNHVPAAPLPPDDPPPDREPSQHWPTRLLEVGEVAPAPPASDVAPPASDVAPPADSPVAATAPAKPRGKRHRIVTLPPPDFEAGEDYDPQPPPQGFSRETVLLDEVAAAAGRLQVLRRLPMAPARPRIELADEPLIMLLPALVKARLREPVRAAPPATAESKGAPPPPPPQAPAAPPTPMPMSVQPPATPAVPLRVPVRRSIVTLTRPVQTIIPSRPAPAVVIEKPVQASSIEDGWIGSGVTSAIEIRRCERTVRPEADQTTDPRTGPADDAVMPETAFLPSDTVPVTDAALLPAGDPESELRFDEAEPAEAMPALSPMGDLEIIDLEEGGVPPLTFEEEPAGEIEFGREDIEPIAEADLLADWSDPDAYDDDVAGRSAVEREAASSPDHLAPPPVEIAPICDSADAESASQSNLQWLGETPLDDETVLAPEVMELPPAEEHSIATPASLVAEDTPVAEEDVAVIVAEPIRRSAMAESAPVVDIALHHKRIRRRVVYVQDGAVLPLSARRLRRTMAKVRPLASAAVPADAVRAGTARPIAMPSTEAFHDDGL